MEKTQCLQQSNDTVLMTDFNEPTDALDYNKALECTFTGNNVFDHYKIE